MNTLYSKLNIKHNKRVQRTGFTVKPRITLPVESSKSISLASVEMHYCRRSVLMIASHLQHEKNLVYESEIERWIRYGYMFEWCVVCAYVNRVTRQNGWGNMELHRIALPMDFSQGMPYYMYANCGCRSLLVLCTILPTLLLI